jgi:hypothetical protein
LFNIDNEQDAARAYSRSARELRGKKAQLNPAEGEQGI